MENGPTIVDLPIEDGDFSVRYVSLPEGIMDFPTVSIVSWWSPENIQPVIPSDPSHTSNAPSGKQTWLLKMAMCSGFTH